jgi:type II secretory pathway pseudopilin PulG
MAAPAVLPAAAATVEPSVLFELREPGRAGGGGGGVFGGGGGGNATTPTNQLYAVPRVVCLDACGATGGVSFSADAAGRLGGEASAAAAATTAADAPPSSSSSLHRAPPIPKSAFVRALEAQEILVRQLSLSRNPLPGSDPSAAARLEERQQRQLEAAARALDEAAAQAGVALPSSSGGGGISSIGDEATAVRYWTDYLKVQLHPRSAVLVPGVWHGVHALDGYGSGGACSLASSSGGGGGAGGGAGGALSGGAAAEAREAAVDALRCWGEACDRLQGLQVLADDMTGFGALGGAVLREASDDLFPRRPVLYFSLRGPDRPGSVLGSGGGRGAAANDEEDDEDDEFGLGKGTGRGAGSRVGGGGGGGGGRPAGGGATRQRQLLSEALSAAEAACPEDGFASLYVPLAAPAPGSAEARSLPWLRLGGGPYSSSAAGAAYRSAALLAAAADTATLPSRVASGAAGAVGAGLSLADLCRTLQARPSGGPSAPMAALGVALPCGAVEENGGVEGGDPRERRAPTGQRPAFSSSLYETLSLPTVASLTPGVRIGGTDNGNDPRLLSESLVLRGARDARSGAAAPLASAAACLDAALLAERRRLFSPSAGSSSGAWLQQRCVVAAPLAVPLPFPGLFAGRVTRDGCVSLAAGGGGGGGGGAVAGGGGAGHHVATAPVLSRLAASAAFSGKLEAMAAALRPSSGVGVLAAAWGYDKAELGEMSERLVRMGGGGGGDGDD